MNRVTLTIAALAALTATPALACGMMQQTATAASTGAATAQAPATQAPMAQPPSAAMGGMMCGRPMTSAQAQPNAPQQPGQGQGPGGCPCCRNMAMMQPGPQQGMQNMPGMGGHSMPGMQPGSPGTPPATPAPEQPRP